MTLIKTAYEKVPLAEFIRLKDELNNNDTIFIREEEDNNSIEIPIHIDYTTIPEDIQGLVTQAKDLNAEYLEIYN